MSHYEQRKNKEGCGCRWCEGERPFPEAITQNCGGCGEFIYWAWDNLIKEKGCFDRHGFRNYIGNEPHKCMMDYSHGKRLGKVWI